MIDWRWNFLSAFLLTLFAFVLALWPLRKQSKVWLNIPFLCILVGLFYWYWGSLPEVMAYEQRQLKQEKAKALLQTIKSPKILIERLQMHVAQHPKDARGWYFLGRLYASQHQWKASLDAFEKAYTLKPEDELMALNYAQGLFSSKEHPDEAKARDILKAVLKHNPHQADALAMMAMSAQNHAEWQSALNYWQQLLSILPPQSEEAAQIRKTIIYLRKK